MEDRERLKSEDKNLSLKTKYRLPSSESIFIGPNNHEVIIFFGHLHRIITAVVIPFICMYIQPNVVKLFIF